MKKAIDRFSDHSRAYKKFRPTYPQTLYKTLLQHVHSKNACWDCGTGNGQVALALAPHFKSVYATDISQQQLDNAEHRKNIHYSAQRAEQTSFGANQFDLITVAQAIHWFDLESFGREVRRVSKQQGILAVWGYGLLRFGPLLDKAIDYFYQDVVGPYWDKERAHIDKAYSTLSFDFEPIPLTSKYAIRVNWDLRHLLGYLNTWSSVQRYQALNEGMNPVDEFAKKVRPLWNKKGRKRAEFPIFMKLWRVA